MSGYVYFKSTGVKEIDAISEALEDAGRAYHHTSEWGEEIDYRDDGKSYLDLIQNALDNAARQSIPEEMLLEWLDKLIDLTKKILREEERTVARAIEQGMVTGVLSGLRDIITSGFMEGEE